MEAADCAEPLSLTLVALACCLLEVEVDIEGRRAAAVVEIFNPDSPVVRCWDVLVPMGYKQLD